MASKVDKRRREFVAILANESAIHIKDMAKLFKVSQETIRKDFDFLAQEYGYIRRHGSLGQKEEIQLNSHYHFHENKMVNIEVKKQMCYRGVDLVNDGDCIYIDGGSTVASMMSYLGRKKNVTIVTPSIPILTRYTMENMEESFVKNGHELLFLGGQVHSEILTTYGMFFDSMIESMNIDTMFLSFDGIDRKKHCTNGDHVSAHIVRRVKCQSNRIVVLADTSKFGIVKRYKSMDWSEVDVLITPMDLSKDWIKMLKDSHVVYYKV